MSLRTFKALAAASTLVLLAAVGCTDTTEQPKSSVTTANVFNDPSSYQALLARVYGGLALSGQQGPAGNADIAGIDEGFSQYMRLYWECEELPTDEAIIGWGDIGLPEMNTVTWTSSSRMVVAMYYRIELQASFANEFLRQTSPAALAAHSNLSSSLLASIQQWRAEARFLRALSYWHGLDLFGNIPLVTENSPVGSLPTQTKRVDIFNWVVAQLDSIRTQLPSISAANYGRATTAAADMLLAELYLNDSVYTGTPAWSQALTAATNVIGAAGVSLDPSYAKLFQADNNTSPEMIFPVEEDGNHTQSYGGVTFLIHAECGGNMSAATYGLDYCWGGTRLKPEAVNNYGAGDARAMFYTNGQTLAVTTIGSFGSGYASVKYTNKTSGGANGSNPTFVDTDFPLFRLGEAYLIYAEACLRSGGGACAAQALTYVNALRTRAGIASLTAPQMTLDTLLAERGRELLWEAHRRTDLIRYGKYTGSTYLWSWKGGVAAGTSIPAYYALYPLPATEIAANPNLTQNPGY